MAKGHRLRMLTNTSLGEIAPTYGFEGDLLTKIQEQDLLDVFGENYLAATIRGYRGELTETELEGAASVLLKALDKFRPDIVITYTTAPWLRTAFPDALIFHMEYGLYSRPPFPESFYLDPLGKFGNSTLSQYVGDLRSYQAKGSERNLVKNFRKRYLDDILKPNSPFKDMCDGLRKKFDHLMLLPLQFSGHYGFEGTSSYTSQDGLLQDVIQNVPKSTCVVALPHSTAIHMTREFPDPKLLESLIAENDNLFMNAEMSRIIFPSQFMLAHMDSVASVSSSVALQGLLWGRTIYAVGNSHINAIADYEGIDTLQKCEPQVDDDQKVSMLGWLLSHYHIPGLYLHDPDWIMAHMQKSLDKWRDGVRGLEFFERIDHPAVIERVIHESGRPGIPIYK